MTAELEAGRATPAAPGETPAAGVVAQNRAPASARMEFANTLRGVAAMSVICAHLGNTFWHWPVLVEWLTGIAWVPAKPSNFS